MSDFEECLIKEIIWCEGEGFNKTEKSDEWKLGFVEGLKQAILIYKKFNNDLS